MPSCSSCGSEIPDGQGSSCSMCYGDIAHGRDGYYEEWARQQDQAAHDAQLADQMHDDQTGNPSDPLADEDLPF